MSSGLSHVAVSVPAGTLTDEYRSEVIGFYRDYFEWQEIESLRLPDRLTLNVGGDCYMNIRERAESMVCHGYEHFGLLIDSPEEVEAVWSRLERDAREVHLEPLTSGDEGYRSFRFRYLMPMAVEVQHFPRGDAT